MKALVVGGGPAGCSAALGLQESGFVVRLIEQRPFWTGRVCGSFLSAEASAQLRDLKISARIYQQMVLVPTTRVTTPSGFESHIPTVQRNQLGIALSRNILDTALLEQVSANGIEVRTGTRLIAYERTGQGWNVDLQSASGRETTHADALILADGRVSIGIPPQRKAQAGWYGFNATYVQVAQRPGEQSLHFFPGGYIGVVTYADGRTNVCGLVHRAPNSNQSWEQVFTESCRRSPALKFTLRGAERNGEWRGTGPLPFGIYVNNKGPVRVGDAAAVGDPFMGEGIGRALAAGSMLRSSLAQLRREDAPLSRLASRHAALWNKTYRKRWRFNSSLRWMLAHSATFKLLELLLRAGPVVTHATRAFHTGYNPTYSEDKISL